MCRIEKKLVFMFWLELDECGLLAPPLLVFAIKLFPYHNISNIARVAYEPQT